MVRSPDYYALLGVDAGAPVEIIRAHYRARARRDHPDRSTGSTEAMVQLNAAWAVLRDPVTRAAYDRTRRVRARVIPAVPIVGAPPDRPVGPGPLARRETKSEPAGITLDFGRYAGWSLAEVAAYDRAYVEWLGRAQVGRSFGREIERLLHHRGSVGSARVPA